MRNTQKQAEQGINIIKKNNRIDLSTKELNQLLRNIKDEPLMDGNMLTQIYNAITEAFYMGVAVGARNSSRG